MDRATADPALAHFALEAPHRARERRDPAALDQIFDLIERGWTATAGARPPS